MSITASAQLGGSAGLEYNDGDINGVKNFSKSATLDHNLDLAQAQAEAKIGPDVKFEAGWDIPILGELAATAALDIKTGVKATYTTSKSPPGEICIPIHAAARLVFAIPGLEDITAGPETVIDENITCKQFGAQKIHWKGTLTGEWIFPTDNPRQRSTTKLTWNVDATTFEKSFFDLAFNGSWTRHGEYSSDCGNGIEHREITDSTGSGTWRPDDPGHGLLIYTNIPGKYYFGLPTMYGTHTTTTYGCDGTQTTSTGNDGTGVEASDLTSLTSGVGNEEPKPSGIRLAGSRELIDSNTERRLSWDITATCEDGGAPDAEWAC